jgi:hypothetical protein
MNHTTHELFEILDAVCPKWQERYKTLRDAAEAAKALPEFYDYMHTGEGRQRALRFQSVPDTIEANRLEAKMRHRMFKRARHSYGNDIG